MTMHLNARWSGGPNADAAPVEMDAQTVRSELERSDFFRGLDAAALNAMIQSASVQRLRPGQVLLRQGEEPRALYMVASGCFKLSHVKPDGKQLTIGYMGPRDLIGCVAVFRGIPYPVTALAVVDSSALTWTAAGVRALLERYGRVARNALSIVGGRVEDMLERVREVSTEPVEQRIARTLLRLAAKHGCPGSGGLEIGFPLSGSDIAELTGTTHYTVSRIFSSWEAQGMIRSGRRRVVLLNVERLRGVTAET